jgi:cytochrome c oxidase subunit 4
MADTKALGHEAHDHGHGEGHDHGHDDGAVHAHISSVKFYIGILAALMVFTLLTVGVASIELGKLNLVVAVVIASMKATLVVLFFMHLKYDNKFNATMLVCGLLFIGVFFAYTLNDTDTRGALDEAQGSQILPSSGVPAPGGMGDAGFTYSPERSHENVMAPKVPAAHAGAHGGHGGEAPHGEAPHGEPAPAHAPEDHAH